MSSHFLSTTSTEMAQMSFDGADSDSDMDEADRSRAMCEYVRAKILPGLQAEVREFQVVPLELMTYAVRAMLKPTPLIQEIPILLIALGHIEQMRLVFMEKMQRMRKLNQRIRRAKSQARDSAMATDPGYLPTGPLTRGEEIILENALDSGSELRASYREAVAQYSLLHAWETWCSPEHTELDTVLKTYFPLKSLWGEDMAEVEAEHIFHHHLDDSERGALLEVASILLKLLARYGKEKRKKLAPKPGTEAFRERYALQVDIEALVASTMRYVNEVEESVARIKAFLEDEDDSN